MNGAAKGTLKRVVAFQHAVSSAAFRLQHHIQDPRKVPESFAKSLDSVTLAGLEGVLRAYENMLPTHPGIRSAVPAVVAWALANGEKLPHAAAAK